MNQVIKQVTRVALVTGAGRRIGAAIAEHLHQAGFRVAIHCHQSFEAAHLLACEMNLERPDSAMVFQADLTSKHSAQKLMTQVLEWAPKLSLLVNNAAIFKKTTLNDDRFWDAIFTLNVKAPFWLSHEAFIPLSKQEGSIINITDLHAIRPLKGYSIYCQSKAALGMQTQSLAREFAPLVRVNAIAPGAMAWPEDDNALSEQQQQKIIKNTPLKRHGDPLFIANAVLAIAENPFITGQTLCVDGGRGLIQG
ncbi:MAG: pteridine reductase [Legionellales bacterium]|nr:pteridine reductase [Legionellales bacterium]